MSLKMRGQEVTLRIAVDGKILRGSMVKATDFTAKPRQNINEDDYLGEDETDLDFQHHGWDLNFSVDTIDAIALDLLDDIIEREKNHTAHPDITISAIYTFREPSTRGRMYVYHGVFVMADEEGTGGRKEKHKVKFSCKAKRRRPLTV